MRRRQPVTTDAPTNPITACAHKVGHMHGTNTGYASCNCRCPDCKDAARRFREDRRRDSKRRDLKPPTGRSGIEPPAPSKDRTLRNSPLGTNEDIDAAARVVQRHAHNLTEARDFLHMLGIAHLLVPTEVAP